MAFPYTPLPSNGQTTTSSRLTTDQSRSGMLIMYVSLFMFSTIAAGFVYAVGEVFVCGSEQLFNDVLCVHAESVFQEKEMKILLLLLLLLLLFSNSIFSPLCSNANASGSVVRASDQHSEDPGSIPASNLNFQNKSVFCQVLRPLVFSPLF